MHGPLQGNLTLYGPTEENSGCLAELQEQHKVRYFLLKLTIVYNDLWKYSNGTWTWISGRQAAALSLTYGSYGEKGIGTSSTVPGGRSDATIWVDSSTGLFWLFGGLGFSDTGSGDMQDLWVYNTSSNIWTWVDGDTKGDLVVPYGNLGQYTKIPPSGRTAIFSIRFNDSFIWIYGGAQLNVFRNWYDDMFILNIAAFYFEEEAMNAATTGNLLLSLLQRTRPTGYSRAEQRCY
jgi:hypothetical protein